MLGGLLQCHSEQAFTNVSQITQLHVCRRPACLLTEYFAPWGDDLNQGGSVFVAPWDARVMVPFFCALTVDLLLQQCKTCLVLAHNPFPRTHAVASYDSYQDLIFFSVATSLLRAGVWVNVQNTRRELKARPGMPAARTTIKCWNFVPPSFSWLERSVKNSRWTRPRDA